MKKILLLFIVVACAFSASAHNITLYNPMAQADTVIYVTKGGDNGAFITSGAPKDTFMLRASDNPFSYLYVSVSGNSTDSITIMNYGGQVQMTAGITLDNCNYVCVNGSGVNGIKYGFKVVNGSSVPGVIKDASNYISWHNTDLENNGTGQGVFWDKTEVSDAQAAGCPAANNLIFPHAMAHHNVYNNFFGFSGGDAYFMSTGSLGGRPYTDCNGNTTTTQKPMQGIDINIYNNTIDSLGRSFQLSGTKGGHIYGNHVTHMGYEFNGQQGYGIALGGGDSMIEVDHNYVKWTYNPNFLCYSNGLNNIHDNFFDSADYFDNTHPNTTPNASMQFSSILPNTTWLIQNNTVGFNNASPSTQIALYNDNGYSTTANVICNNNLPAGGAAFVGGNASSVVYSGCTGNTYLITTNAGSNGTISPTSLNVNAGASQTFTITANTGYHLATLTVDGTSITPVTSYTFTNVNSTHTIAATFAVTGYTITATQASNGSITPTGTTIVNAGGSQTYTITPNTGYSTTSLIVNGGTISPASFYVFSNVNSNQTISAVFSINTYTVNFSAGANGSVNGNLNQTVNYNGSTTAVTATPNAGFYFASWSILNNNASPLIVNNVTANASYVANFLPLPAPAIIVAMSGTFSDGSSFNTGGKGTKKKPVKVVNLTWQDANGNSWVQPISITSKPL